MERMSVLDSPLVLVDIETNGLNHVRGRVIEVAAIRVEGGRVVREFSSLVDPETELPRFITNLTGIRADDLRTAPAFHQIADELMDILDGAVFVAHNVRFDYSFLKQEFKRLGRPFLPRQLCTAKLSRALYPQERSHKLESLIRRHGFSFTNRHRAYDDAAVLLQFLQLARDNFGDELVEAAIARQIRRPALPKAIPTEVVNSLPDGPGVYVFYDEAHRPLYVGKSINIRKRVLSHFGQDHAESKEFKIAQTIGDIETITTAGELSALLLESGMVKDLQPLYNRKLRRTRTLMLARQRKTETGHIAVALEEASGIDPDDTDNILAVFSGRAKAKSSLETLQKTYDLCPKLLGLEKAGGTCFLYQLHKCRGACGGEEAADSYNERLLTAFERRSIEHWPYRGAVLIQEKGTTDDAALSGIIVDKWCVLAELKAEPFCEPQVVTRRKIFDLDTYKILQSYLSQKMSALNVEALSAGQLAAFGL